MSQNVTIFYNSRCSKSRQTLQLLQEQGVQPTVIEYLHTPPSTTEIADLLVMLNLSPRELMRTKEAAYRELGLDAEFDDAKLIDAMHCHPILIERPIVVAGGAAAIGRPPENVLTLLPTP